MTNFLGGNKGRVSNIDLFAASSTIFKAGKWAITTTPWTSDSSSYLNKLASFLYSFYPIAKKSEDKFEDLLDNRIDIITIEVHLSTESGKQMHKFLNSLEALHHCLNNLEEHLHAFTNFYIPLNSGIFANLPHVILGPILLSSALLIVIVQECLLNGLVNESFVASTFILTLILFVAEYFNKTNFIVSSLAFFPLNSICFVYGTAGLLWAFCDLPKISLVVYALMAVHVRLLLKRKK